MGNATETSRMTMSNWDTIKQLNEHHMNLTWSELQSRFGFNIDHWKKEFKTFMSSQPRNVSELDGFIQFGNRRINPVMNNILGRNELFPTFNNFLCFIIRK